MLKSSRELCIQFGQDSLLCLPGARGLLLLSALDTANLLPASELNAPVENSPVGPISYNQFLVELRTIPLVDFLHTRSYRAHACCLKVAVVACCRA